MNGDITMGKSVKAEIVTVEGHTLKVDKLQDRTIRTIRVGDYIAASLDVRGTTCHFYTRVVEVVGNTVRTVFGSEDKAHDVAISKGYKVNVYRPIA